MANSDWAERVTRGLERGASSSYGGAAISGGARPLPTEAELLALGLIPQEKPEPRLWPEADPSWIEGRGPSAHG